MEQTILFWHWLYAKPFFCSTIATCCGVRFFLLPPVSAAWLPCRSCSRQPDFASPHPVWLSALSLEYRAAFFFC